MSLHVLHPRRRFLQRFAKARRGNVAILFALSLPVVAGGLGYGVETSYWFLERHRMQGAADAAAHAGAMEARIGSDYATVKAAAVRAAADNGFTTANGVTVNTPPTSGAAIGNSSAVEVKLATTVDRVFTGIFNAKPVPLSTRAVAKYNSAATACIVALHPTASHAANFSGNTSVALSGCTVMSNSAAADAVNLQGSANLTADCVIAVGGVQTTAAMTLTECDAPVINAAPVADPFKNVEVPTRPAPCLNDNQATLSPGRYCNGMTLKNNKTLLPGDYYIEGDDLKFSANANVTGSGVTFYLAAGRHVDMNANAKAVLSAPTTGPRKGVLFFGDRTTSGTNKFNGTADSTLTGAIYFKNQAVEYLGNFAGIGGCTQVVARTIEWSGSSQINANCSALGMTAIPAMMTVQLTE